MFDIYDADIELSGEFDEVDLENCGLEDTALVEDDAHFLPADLESIPVGPFLFVIVGSVDRSQLSGRDVVRLLQARERLLAHLEAESMADTVEVAHCVDPDHDRIYEASEFAAAEVAAALHLTRRAAETRVDTAVNLRLRLPKVWRMLQRGDIDVARAKVMLRSTEHVDQRLAREIIDRVSDAAPGLTTGQLRARIQRLCLEADAEAARKAYEKTIEDRRVEAGLGFHGAADFLILDAPPDDVASASSNVDALAKSLHCLDGETRSLDQLRADVALDLLAGRGTGKGAGRATMEIRVDASTLAELDDRAAEIPGMGPVIADIARQFNEKYPDGDWRYAVTNANRVLDTGPTRRRPSTAQRRRAQAVNPTCVHPGCRMPSSSCDIDHTVAYSEGGLTTDCNLAPLCRHHHRVKHEGGWQMRRIGDGVYHWISRLGHTYVTTGQSP